jgi:hypothetical protein
MLTDSQVCRDFFISFFTRASRFCIDFVVSHQAHHLGSQIR